MSCMGQRLTNGWMSLALPGTTASEGDLVEQRNVVPHNSSLPYDYPSSMVNHHTPAKLSCWVDIDLHHL